MSTAGLWLRFKNKNVINTKAWCCITAQTHLTDIVVASQEDQPSKRTSKNNHQTWSTTLNRHVHWQQQPHGCLQDMCYIKATWNMRANTIIKKWCYLLSVNMSYLCIWQPNMGTQHLSVSETTGFFSAKWRDLPRFPLMMSEMTNIIPCEKLQTRLQCSAGVQKALISIFIFRANIIS